MRRDTYIALRALIEYTNRKRLRDVSSLTVTVDAVALSGATRVLHVANDNIAVMQYIDIPEAWGTVKVTAKGAGYAILQMSVQYNVDIPRFQTEPPVPAFSLHSSQYYYGRNQSHIEFQGCASCNGTGHIARECAQSPDEPSCYNCNKTGHIARNCPEGGRDSSNQTCYNCNKSGHISRNCPDGTKTCYVCGKPGHISRDCEEERN